MDLRKRSAAPAAHRPAGDNQDGAGRGSQVHRKELVDQGRRSGGVPERICEAPFLSLEVRRGAETGGPAPAMTKADMLRNLIERILAGPVLVLLSRLFLILAAAILLDNGRPVFFRQLRVGREGRPFRLLKFRSMRGGAPGPQVTASTDPRITRIGGVLRKYKLDELPQLWNVLAGDMSLVGPRPEVPKFVDLASGTWQKVLAVRPGITDLPTLIFRDEERVLTGREDAEQYYRDVILPQKLMLSMVFLEHRGIWLDLKLIALTLYYACFPSRFDAARVRSRFQWMDGGGSVLLIGTFLSGRGGSRGVCEDLAERLSTRGWLVITASAKLGRISRVADMLLTTWRNRRLYGAAQVDVYSGPAFVWA